MRRIECDVWRLMASGLLVSLMVALAMPEAAAGAARPPQMDYTLVAPQGKTATIETFVGKGGAPVKEQTRVTLRWDDTAIEIVFDCIDSAIASGLAKERDSGKTWKDDSVGVLFDIGHTHEVAQEPIALALSVSGGLYDRRGKDSAWNIQGIESDTTSTDTGWRARIRVPWAGLGVRPKLNDVWGLNVTRIDHEGKCYANMKYMAWTPFDSNAEEIDRWGHVVFAAPDSEAAAEGVTSATARVRETHEAISALRVYPNEGNILAARMGQTVETRGFVRKPECTPEQQETSVSVTWDKKALSIMFDCKDDAIAAEYTERDAMKMWKDDCVVAWLDIGHTHNAEKRMVMLQLSASGALHDVRDGKIEFNVAGVENKVTRTSGGWRGEIRVPWKGLEIGRPEFGDAWGINFTRIDQPGHYDYTKTEYTSWCPNMLNDDTALDRWGHILFMAPGKEQDVTVTDEAKQKLATTHAARRRTIMEAAGAPVSTADK